MTIRLFSYFAFCAYYFEKYVCTLQTPVGSELTRPPVNCKIEYTFYSTEQCPAPSAVKLIEFSSEVEEASVLSCSNTD